MSEQWENIMENELDFLYHSPKYEAELKERLYENELSIQYPVTHFDSEQGRIYRSCPGTEEQAIRRIEVREAVEALLEHMNKRIKRLWNAIGQLSEEEQDIISWVYIERDTAELYMARLSGFRTVKDFRNAKQKALRKLLDIYQKEREEAESEFERKRSEWRRLAAKQILNIAK